MTARSITELKDALTRNDAAKAFTSGFAEAYFAQAFGVLPKAEIDLLVFRLLIGTGVLNADGSIFEVARALNVTPTRARNLLFQYQLRFIDEAKAESSVLRGLATARFSVDDKRLAFGIESPLSRATIDGRLKAVGVYADISLSGEILRVPLDQFDVFITMLIGADRAAELEKQLQKQGYLKGNSLPDWLKKFAGAAAGGTAGAAGKEGFAKVFAAVSRWLEGGGPDAFGELMSGGGIA